MVKGHNMTSVISKDPLTYQQSEIFIIINFGFLCTILCFFGLTTNTINSILFCKQGFNNTMNISFFALAISDICCLILELWINICFNPLLRKADIPFIPEQVQIMTGAGPYVGFGRINAWITVFITAERCLGIAFPLKVKQIITKQRTTVIMCVIYSVNILAITAQQSMFNLNWIFVPERNRTLYGLVPNDQDNGSGILAYLFHAILGYTSFIGVIVLTVILAVNLQRKSAWRQGATLANENAKSVLNRDRRTIKLVVLLASVMIGCYIPCSVVAIVIMVEPEFNLLGVYENSFFSFLSFGFVFQNINSSVNIFLYYTMSRKYRETFQAVFSKCFSKNTSVS